MQQHGQLSRRGNDGAFLPVPPAMLRQFQAPPSQVTVGSKRTQNAAVSKRRSVRAVAEQQPGDDAGSSVIKNIEEKRKTKLKRRVPVTALIAWPSFHLQDGTEVDKQVAAPAETRTPNLHRANNRSLEECGWKGGDSGDSAERKSCLTKTNHRLDSDRPSHGRAFTLRTRSMSEMVLYQQLSLGNRLLRCINPSMSRGLLSWAAPEPSVLITQRLENIARITHFGDALGLQFL
jgi:hypothetical protein